MGKTKSTANDAQLKARRTSLGKKSKDELINIILRKDSTERKNNAKIQELTALLKEADSLNEEKATRIFNFNKELESLQSVIKAKQEVIDDLIIQKNNISEDSDKIVKKYVHIKHIAELRRKVIFTCFGIITALIIGLVLL